MVNYNKSIVYKLCCKDPEITDIYIGSTTDFTKRKYNHKNCCYNKDNRLYNKNVYKFIIDNGNWDNWDMIQIEAYNAENKRDLESRERHWIELLKSTLNKCIPTRTASEYRLDNKEIIIEKKSKHYIENKEKIALYQSEYRLNNIEKYIEKDAKYYQSKKEQLAIKVSCICGSIISKSFLTGHKKSKKHIKYLESI